MKKDNSEIIATIIVFIFLITLAFIISVCSTTVSTKVYNNGTHKNCGGHWIYENAIGHRYSTNYIYHCDKCGTIYEFTKKY